MKLPAKLRHYFHKTHYFQKIPKKTYAFLGIGYLVRKIVTLRKPLSEFRG